MRRAHLTMLSHLLASPWEVTSDDLSLFLARDDWAPEYRRGVRGTVRLFYRWAVMTDRLTRDLSLVLSPVSIPRALPRPAPDDAVLVALERADDRTRLAVELGMYAGLRICEVACLQGTDVLPGLLRATGKAGTSAWCPFTRHSQRRCLPNAAAEPKPAKTRPGCSPRRWAGT